VKSIKVASIIGSSIKSDGTKYTAFVGVDSKVYYISMLEGWHKDIKPNNLVCGVDEVPLNSHGYRDLTFIFNN
jgi:hypothetical protein